MIRRLGRHDRFICRLFILMAFIVVNGPDDSMGEASVRRISLPAGEVSDLLFDWWTAKGYRVRRSEPDAGYVILKAEKDKETWEVNLSPHSALETQVSLTFTGDEPESHQLQFWDQISQYRAHPSTGEPPKGSSRNIPTAVLSKMESVVCINAKTDETVVQFSGFIIDTDGLILCTAHDLSKSQHITVTLYDGQVVMASLLFKDTEADLSVLKIALKTKTAIRLSEGRNLLGMGETLFSVGCPSNLRGTIYEGTVNAPPRKMNELPLWQVNMEIHHGSSGSPVFDVSGHIVAVVKGRYRGTTTTGFLIPMETVFNFLKEKHPS